MIMLFKFIFCLIFLTVVLPHMSLSLQNTLTGTDLKFCKGSSITTKEDNLRFSVETPFSDVLTFRLAIDNILRIFQIFQEEKQRNDYSVLLVNRTVYITKNGQATNETRGFILKEISVEFASSEDALWAVFNVRGDGSGKNLKVDCSSSDSDEYIFEESFKDFEIVQNDTFLVKEDNVRFLIKSPTGGNLSFQLIFDNNLRHKLSPTWVEGSRWNHYNVLYLNNTTCIIQNGYVIKQVVSCAPKEIYVKFTSKQNTFYIFFKECGHETSKPCDIQCRTCKNVKTSSEVSKEHVPQANVNTRHQENSDDSENTRKRSDLNSEPTDPSTDSSPKAPSTNNNHVLIIISVIVVIILVIAVAYIINRCKSSHAENINEMQNLQQENAEDTD
jgi:hypothetical protein